MERRSDKHSPRVDEDMEHGVGSMTGGSPVEARAEEWREQEGPADGESTPDARLQEDEVEARAELARHLQPSRFPGTRADLLASAEEMHAPDEVLSRLRRLPDGEEFANVAAVWAALGGHVEHRAPSGS